MLCVGLAGYQVQAGVSLLSKLPGEELQYHSKKNEVFHMHMHNRP
jgi:hypothetical protein